MWSFTVLLFVQVWLLFLKVFEIHIANIWLYNEFMVKNWNGSLCLCSYIDMAAFIDLYVLLITVTLILINTNAAYHKSN